MAHVHKLPPGGWPFDDPENVASFSCRHVLEGQPVREVSHDDDDGAWQVLCGEAHEDDDIRIVCLGCLVEREPGLVVLADLPYGWCAHRESPDSPWVRALNECDDEDEEPEEEGS